MHLSLFEQIASELPFKEWGTLYLLEYKVPHSILLYEEAYSENDPNYFKYMKTELETWVKRIIRNSYKNPHFHLHKRFTN
jgi:hypothetical protein